MKNILLYNYNLDVDEYKDVNNGICFYVDYNKYYFLRINRVKTDVELIYNLTQNNNTNYHYILKNNKGGLVTSVGGINYVLLKINGPEHSEVDLNDIINNQKPLSGGYNELRRDNWGMLWSEKVDYLEYQVSELSKNYPIIRSSFSYFVGLAENAIQYYNMLNIKDLSLVVSQKRILSPNYSLFYYNPLSVVIDYKARDIAEYIKSSFFNNDFSWGTVENLVNKNYLTSLECNLLYTRVLYPSYYFDDIYLVLEKGADEEILLKYINRVEEFEDFLRKLYDVLSSNYDLIKIDWITKKSS